MIDNAKPLKKHKFLKFLLGFVILSVAFTIVNYIFFEKKVEALHMD